MSNAIGPSAVHVPRLSGEVVGVCAGGVASIPQGARTIRTAFIKTSISGPVEVGPLGIPTDEHVYEDHGGPDMALLVYSRDHYSHWRSLGLDLPNVGALGENLTVAGLVETDVHLGDVFEVGTATVQVSQPRSPCYKLAVRFGRRDMPVLVQNTGYTGYLLRVLQPGMVSAGDTMRLVRRDEHGVSVSFASRAVNVDRNDHDAAQRILDVDGLGESVRRVLQQRIDAREQLGLDRARLFGDE